MLANEPPRICVFGAAPSTSNLGVHALLESTLDGLLSREPSLEVTVFDYAWNPGPLAVERPGGPKMVKRHGANPSKRFWRSESLTNMRVSGRLWPTLNPGVRAVHEASAVLDLSGGDSFTDLYGKKRFWTVTHPKRLALDLDRPLVLLPQTYGPFEDERFRRIACDTVRRADLAWSRDERSFQALCELAGSGGDDGRFRRGVDMAFALTPRPSLTPIDPVVDDWLGDSNRTVVGINVSGLLWNQPAAARSRFTLRCDYRQAMTGIARELLCVKGVHVVLVPHVLQITGSHESDGDASRGLLEEIPRRDRERIRAIDGEYGASQVKELIGRLDWFLGARMHSTIAALSMRVPTIGAAYSGKFQGVFESCGQGQSVTDLRNLSAAEVVSQAISGFEERQGQKAELVEAIPSVIDTCKMQLDAICALIGGSGVKA